MSWLMVPPQGGDPVEVVDGYRKINLLNSGWSLAESSGSTSANKPKPAAKKPAAKSSPAPADEE